MALGLLSVARVISAFEPLSESDTETGFAKRRKCNSRKIINRNKA